VAFTDPPSEYILQFASAFQRRQFLELITVLQGHVEVWCPDVCSDIIPATRPAPLHPQQFGAPSCVQVHGTGSPLEDITIWIGVADWKGRSPSLGELMHQWLPPGEYDWYTVAAFGIEDDTGSAKEEWVQHLHHHLGPQYTVVDQCVWGTTVLCSFVRNCLWHKVSNVGATISNTPSESDTPCGAIVATAKYCETMLCFVCCRLPSGPFANSEREAVLADVLSDVHIADLDLDVTARACHTFLFGALNYTVERRRTEVQQLQKHNQYALILKGDQLKQQQMGGLLPGFCEHPIAFDPTEKSDPCLSPSYTDRILWRSLSSDRVQCITYSSVPQADIEDRAPIYATFRLKCQRPFISLFAPPVRSSLHLEQVVAKENRRDPKSNLVLTIWSPCVEQPLHVSSKAPQPMFQGIPSLPLVVGDLEFLSTQTLFLVMKDQKTGEVKGTGRIPLLPLMQNLADGLTSPYTFDVPLELRARIVGTISGALRYVRYTNESDEI